MKGSSWCLAVIVAALAGTVPAILCAADLRAGGTSPVVVELFTSQGCSSCPPADAVLSDLANRQDVIALGLHVDYWDYLGWKDVFASPGHSDRQRAYAHAAGRRSVFTPEMVINGRQSVVGHDAAAIEAGIAEAAAATAAIRLTLHRQQGRILVHLAPVAADLPRSSLVLFRYLPERTVEIARGENAGHRLTYRNIVVEMSRIGTWDGRSVAEFTAPDVDEGPVALIVQEGNAGPVLAAARAE
jgi:hypothetical protein